MWTEASQTVTSDTSSLSLMKREFKNGITVSIQIIQDVMDRNEIGSIAINFNEYSDSWSDSSVRGSVVF